MEAVPKSDIKSVIKSDIRFDISTKWTTWIGHKYVLAATNRISYMEICLVLLMLHITECRTHVSLKSFVKPLSWWAQYVVLEFRWHFFEHPSIYGVSKIEGIHT